MAASLAGADCTGQVRKRAACPLAFSWRDTGEEGDARVGVGVGKERSEWKED